MLKLFRIIRFLKAVTLATDRCHDRLTRLNGWPITSIGENDSYGVKSGVVTEYEVYEALISFYDKVHKELNRYRLKKKFIGPFPFRTMLTNGRRGM